MIRASRVTIALSHADLWRSAQSYAIGPVTLTGLELEQGSLRVNLKVGSDRVPSGVPVELTFTVLKVEGAQITLGVVWSNMGLVPGFIKEWALHRAFEAVPGTYTDGRFILDLSEFLEDQPVTFAIKEVALLPDWVEVTLADVAVYPLVPGAIVLSPVIDLVPVASSQEVPLPEHQDYYKGLRERVSQFAEERAPRWVKPLLPWLLLAPDIFALMVRLARDPRVPTSAKLIAGIAIAYFISPIDLIPDMIPILGQLDDEAVALFALNQIIRQVDPVVVQELWPGDGEVLDVINHGVALFGRLLPKKLIALIQLKFERKAE
jgi:uncharacterized membrane protein YkvA (DUF1232 family)